MTGAEALARLESVGARIVILPGGALDVTYPPGPQTEALVDELAAHKPEAVAVLRARPAVAALRLPGREPARPCLQCLGECAEDELFHEACFQRWMTDRAARRAERRATLPGVATSPAHSIPPETSPEGSA